MGSEEPSALFLLRMVLQKSGCSAGIARGKKAASESAHKVQRNMEKRL